MRYVLDFGPAASGVPFFHLFKNVNTDENLISAAPVFLTMVSGITGFTWNSGIVLQFRAMLSGNLGLYIPGIIDQTDGTPGIGEGSVRVDHDYGGVDSYRLLDTTTSSPIDNAYIYAYTAFDYDNGNYVRPDAIRGITWTDVNGRWVNALWLDPGDYRLVIRAPGHQTKIVSLLVT
jgi:hypothetical protein